MCKSIEKVPRPQHTAITSVRGRNSESIDAESNTNANHSLRFCVSQRKERNLQYYLYLVRAWTSSVTDKNSAAGVVRVHSFCRGKISKEHQVFVLTIFWSHPWFITKQTHGSMESICWVGKQMKFTQSATHFEIQLEVVLFNLPGHIR